MDIINIEEDSIEEDSIEEDKKYILMDDIIDKIHMIIIVLLLLIPFYPISLLHLFQFKTPTYS